VLLIGQTCEQNLCLATGCPTYMMQAPLPHPFSAFHVFFSTNICTRFSETCSTICLILHKILQILSSQNIHIAHKRHTGYGLDSPGIESQWGQDFSTPVKTGPGAHPASCTMGTGSFPGVKRDQGMMLTPHPF